MSGPAAICQTNQIARSCYAFSFIGLWLKLRLQLLEHCQLRGTFPLSSGMSVLVSQATARSGSRIMDSSRWLTPLSMRRPVLRLSGYHIREALA